ncbi:ABC transporter permease [Paenibacillus humicola]|uniref:ABC transporter permease n=1 Tax=Paenibacillus humicola TaxID=3110540 RepID=UPI00237A0F7D|nr:ABC transporter permease subunit [Paenibacillus humicola]
MRRKNGIVLELNKNRTLFMMVLPAILYFIMFAYLPMAGILLAFKNYQYNLGIFGSPWAGLDNFKFFFTSGTGFIVTRNTILYNFFMLITSHGLAILIAVVLTELHGKWFKRVSQSIIFLPYFMSWIIVGVFVYNLFNDETGVLQTVMKALHMKPVSLYSLPSIWKYIILFFNSWKWLGYNSVVYIAAIAGLDEECYEAADIDGANVFQKIRNITIPGIMPTIIILMLLNIGRIMRGDFQMFYQIVGNNGQLFNATDVIDTYVFRSLINSGDIGMSAAAAFYQSFLGFFIIIFVNFLVKKYNKDYALF